MPYQQDTKQKLIPYIKGEGNASVRESRRILELFTAVDIRDAYKAGLPKHPGTDRNMSKKEYIESRLDMINDQQISDILTVVVNEAENEETVAAINQIISRDNFLASKQGDKYVILGNVVTAKKDNKADVHFREIETKVISALDNAKVSIWLAMAWFTNQRLQKKLLQKLEEGLGIWIVIYKDDINSKYGVDLSPFRHIEMNGTRGGTMHNKFCVIDNQVVITGSYNWSNNAEFRNDENVNVHENNSMATQYSLEFKRLIKEHRAKQ
jgi:phosphatidylserine/phosphatidylglycerophosphate/cardiolipin synthase-like enzyme